MQPDDEVYVGLIYNASSPPDPFDEDSGDCLPQNAKEFSPGFTIPVLAA